MKFKKGDEIIFVGDFENPNCNQRCGDCSPFNKGAIITDIGDNEVGFESLCGEHCCSCPISNISLKAIKSWKDVLVDVPDSRPTEVAK